VENFVRRIVAAIAAGPLPGVAQSAARPAARASAAATTGADRIDSTTALATFDSAWRTVGASLKQRNVSWIDWTDVRRQLRPSAARARSTAELRAVLDRMLRRIGESHFSVIPAHDAGVPAGAAPRNGSALGTAGMAVRFVEHRLTVIERIDDFVAPELGVRDSVGMRRLLALTAAMRAIGGEPGSLVRLVVRTTDGARREIAFTRDSLRGPVSRFGNLPPLPASLDVRRMTLDDGRCVGVLRFEYWLPPVLPALDRAVDQLRSCAGIVLDLRGNLGGVAAMMMGVAGHFMTEAHSLGTMRTGGQEMRFVANPRRVTDAGVPVEPFAGPLAIVVDGLSASTSEMFAAALQGMTRARIFGERTAGQALPATATRLPNGDVLMHVVADFETPTGARIEGVGVTPDEPVPLTRDDLRAGRDAPLIAAVGWIERARPAGSAR
jgi:carboxyl-terminal processing protease